MTTVSMNYMLPLYEVKCYDAKMFVNVSKFS